MISRFKAGVNFQRKIDFALERDIGLDFSINFKKFVTFMLEDITI
jgi:hypothetical protein